MADVHEVLEATDKSKFLRLRSFPTSELCSLVRELVCQRDVQTMSLTAVSEQHS